MAGPRARPKPSEATPATTAAVAVALGLAAVPAGARGPAGRRVAYRLLLAGMAAVALGWAGAVRP